MDKNRKVIMKVKTMMDNEILIYEPKTDVVKPSKMKKNEVYNVWYKFNRNSVVKHTGRYIDNPDVRLTLEFEDKSRMAKEIIFDENGYPQRKPNREYVYYEERKPRFARISIPINNIIRCELAE